ncbi:Glycosyltransferase involved in cell wall bisynthesis [Faunimonas pinastri]|uniref:Glycosyltransferase involved in cell wall bisynthesis n=1 Tax=Faunimonas pinastri TaxID=1855383 RepID=A0A1H8ZFE9_9HYPH|nr:glycosyltransferase [Faunimonas pinastri]SEP63209.1 Glycosyltransferase involved in cell wall bisynthesis [Faunimonas pinastri]
MPQSLSIIHVARAPVGGVFRHIGDLALAQTEAGHRVGMICDANTGGEFAAARIAELAPKLHHGIIRLPMSRSIGPTDLPSIAAVRRRIHAIAPDVIHGHGAKGGVYARLAAMWERTLGRKVVAFYAPHGGSLHFDPKSRKGRLYFLVERELERATDGLLHVSEYEATTYRAKVGVPRCPAFVVHNGLREEEFEPVKPVSGAATFLYIGELRDLKGVDLLIRAMALLKERGQPVSLAMVGDGPAEDKERYRRMIDEAGLADRISPYPPMPAREAFALAHIIVVPSRAESLPYIVLEAGAAGLPMIVSDVGGIPEIFEGETERLVEPGSAGALAGAMQAGLADPEALARQALLRRERLAEIFSLPVMAGRVEAIYRQALARRYKNAFSGSA